MASRKKFVSKITKRKIRTPRDKYRKILGIEGRGDELERQETGDQFEQLNPEYFKSYPFSVCRIVNDKMRQEAKDNYDSLSTDMFGRSIDYRLHFKRKKRYISQSIYSGV